MLTTTMTTTTTARAVRVVTRAERVNNQPPPPSSSPLGRRALVFRGTALPLFLGSVLNFEGERPKNLGVGSFNGMSTGLSLCPPSPNCVGTADEFNDSLHYVPAWTYNDEEKIARGAEATSAKKALEQLVDVVNTTDCDGFEATIVERKDDYLRVEYKSPFFGFVDDVEFWFPEDTSKQKSRVEYRSASRLGQSDGDANRKRIKALRVALQKKYGWKSVGFS